MTDDEYTRYVWSELGGAALHRHVRDREKLTFRTEEQKRTRMAWEHARAEVARQAVEEAARQRRIHEHEAQLARERAALRAQLEARRAREAQEQRELEGRRWDELKTGTGELSLASIPFPVLPGGEGVPARARIRHGPARKGAEEETKRGFLDYLLDGRATERTPGSGAHLSAAERKVSVLASLGNFHTTLVTLVTFLMAMKTRRSSRLHISCGTQTSSYR